MIGTKVQDCSALDYKPEADTPAGTFVGVGNISGFVATEVAAGDMGAIEPCGGRGSLVRVPKVVGESFDAGDPVFFDDVLDKASMNQTTSGHIIGYAVPADGVWTDGGNPVEVAGNADTTVLVYTGTGTAT
ncbi:MAG TPA: DUF2190 family protein [Urbifossiella sp.]|nr:DUF2190 family protein [Urbifossiella sp.]